jgi:hypothetical protein
MQVTQYFFFIFITANIIYWSSSLVQLFFMHKFSQMILTMVKINIMSLDLSKRYFLLSLCLDGDIGRESIVKEIRRLSKILN